MRCEWASDRTQSLFGLMVGTCVVRAAGDCDSVECLGSWCFGTCGALKTADFGLDYRLVLIEHSAFHSTPPRRVALSTQKLTDANYADDVRLSVDEQATLLIETATDVYALARMYSGGCPFWWPVAVNRSRCSEWATCACQGDKYYGPVKSASGTASRIPRTARIPDQESGPRPHRPRLQGAYAPILTQCGLPRALDSSPGLHRSPLRRAHRVTTLPRPWARWPRPRSSRPCSSARSPHARPHPSGARPPPSIAIPRAPHVHAESHRPPTTSRLDTLILTPVFRICLSHCMAIYPFTRDAFVAGLSCGC